MARHRPSPSCSLPATAPTAERGQPTAVRLLKHELTFYQQMKLPAGDYLLTSTS